MEHFMQKNLMPLLVLTMVGLLSSCGKELKKNEEELKTIKGNWGHLAEKVEIRETANGKTTVKNGYMGLASDDASLLINKKPGTAVNVCLSNQDEKNYPGIAEEVKAAVNIWGHYIGRKFPVNIIRVDFPEINSLDPVAALNVVMPLCGPKPIDFVFAFHSLKIAKGANAFDSYTGDPKKYYAKNDSNSVPVGEGAGFFFSGKTPYRLLFLQDYSATKRGVWTPLSKYQGRIMEEAEILEMMIRRDERYIKAQERENIILKNLVHEVGHAWGMCDQYDVATGTNCDPRHSRLNKEKKIELEPKSIMGGTGTEQVLYLTNDDIIGIQEMAKRADLANNTNFGVDKFVINYGDPVVKDPIEALKFWSIKIQESAIIFDVAMLVHKKFDLFIEILSKDKTLRYSKTPYSGLAPIRGKNVLVTYGKLPAKTQLVCRVTIKVGEGENDKKIFITNFTSN